MRLSPRQPQRPMLGRAALCWPSNWRRFNGRSSRISCSTPSRQYGASAGPRPKKGSRYWNGSWTTHRASSRSRRAESTVGEEIDLALAYLDVCTARMAPRLSVVTEIDPEARARRIPCLMLGTLVENAIKHGVGPSRDRVELRFAPKSGIRCWRSRSRTMASDWCRKLGRERAFEPDGALADPLWRGGLARIEAACPERRLRKTSRAPCAARLSRGPSGKGSAPGAQCLGRACSWGRSSA